MKTKVTRGTVPLKNNEMDYFRFGTGERQMVILPGMSIKSVVASAEGVAGAYRLLSDDFTVYCFDRTKFLTENYTISMLADDTAEAMEALGIKDACVFGASQGGMIAQYIAVFHPGLVSKLLLGSSCARLHPIAEKVMAYWISCAEKRDIDLLCDSFLDLLFGKALSEKFGEFIRLAYKDVTEEDFRHFICLGKACNDLNIYDSLDKIKCPVLVLGAENDRVLGAEASVEIAERLGCEIYLYGSEYGHCVFDEAPDYKQRMLSFFNT